jgi:Fe2+ or Zn2+ uptake regulation protein
MAVGGSEGARGCASLPRLPHCETDSRMQHQEFTCVDCGKSSPPTEEGETITKQHGWRVGRRVVGGRLLIESRCAECYARHRTPVPPSPGPLQKR